MAFVAVAAFANAADWVETFRPAIAVKGGSTGTYWPYVAGGAEQYVYTNYDHAADCVYDGYTASVRKVNASPTTEAIGNHVWLRAVETTELSLSISPVLLLQVHSMYHLI